MVRILWKRICEDYRNISYVVVWCYIFICFGLDYEMLGDAVTFGVVFLMLLVVMVIGGISSEPPKGVFIAPFSKDDRRKLVIRMFYRKIAVGMAVMTVALTVAVLLGTITPLNGLTIFIVSLSLGYMMSFKVFYASHHSEKGVLKIIVLTIADVVVFIGACDNEFFSFGKSSGAVLLIVAVILAVVHYFVWRKFFEPMVECYSDYEKMTMVDKKTRSNA